MTLNTTRRKFLSGAGAALSVFVIGLNPKGVLATTSASGGNITPFLTIAEDGTVTAIIKHFEGGQGVSTGLSALIAEEMNMALEDIQWEHAPSDPSRYANLFFGGFQGTGGSTAMANSFIQYRTAAAAAKEMLLAAAAEAWGVDASTLSLSEGLILGAEQQAGIGDFVAAAGAMQVPEAPTLKDPSEFRIIGKEIRARRDTADKINGQAKYAMDVQLEGQMVVALKRAPKYGAKVASFDDSAAREVPGFIMAHTLPTGDAVMAYAQTTWAAFQARDALEIEWDMANAETRNSAAIKEELLGMVRTEPQFTGSATDLATASKAIDGSAKVVEREFYFPMLAHAPMEPMGATIEPTADGGVIMHDGAQFPTANNMVLGQVLELPPEKIQVNTLYAGGFFGRRATPNSDYVVEAALAFATTDRTRPVKLVWSREDDITGGYYRPAMAHRVRVGLDANGAIVGWDHRVAGQSIFKGTAFEPMIVRNGVDHSSVEGIADGAYTIPTQHVGLTDAVPATTVNWWRSVGHSHTGYVMEVMMDLLAEAAGADPVEYRLRYLDETNPDGARMATTLRLAAEKAGWGNDLPQGRARGIAAHKSFGSYCAMVCEISTDADGVVKIENVTAAIDCGIAVTPDVVRAQIEGGIGYGMGHVMRDQITLEDGAVYEQNFPDYEPLRMRDIAEVKVYIVPSTEAPTGVGEPGTPPAGPALANAIAAASGKRVTHLPMTSSDVEFA
ncbi:xanthine dehydrogenase family protein molybdopterin-binding subunit [Marivita geojedonensis]|uniref:Dehydrogenase n=1 Tax=Marivita geojedonensis TaxID=1123756 RepID=A0A1X4NNX1_9RHOB|nr:molybdopterin cofactor-binding domain-containing protein [Marivita geojedonensis]OSQ52411.1 dehydrogenase [Marivita geojedonensis]PRY73261.1 isoquinoline 1-oxidoreductase beta subunit [Marivita geojedonensis]